MDERDDIYELIIDEYLQTGSVKKVVENLNTNTIKVRRVLITEGLWDSESSRKVGELFKEGKTVKEIAKILCMSEKNVQSYMPYTRGAYGGTKSDDAERSNEYRDRQRIAADNQVASKENLSDNIEKQLIEESEDKIIDFPKKDNVAEPQSKLPSVLKLRFELVAPHYLHKGNLDMKSEEEQEFLKLAKAKEGIVREVLVHGETTLHALHYMIQKLFGWQNSHLHDFSLSEEDFNKATDKQKVEQYLKLCGVLFRFPDGEMDDRFWDDDYKEGISFKSWLRLKYHWGFNKDLSIENTYYRNLENVDAFRQELNEKFKTLSKITLEDLSDVGIYFEEPYNVLIEGINIRNIFNTSSKEKAKLSDINWRDFQDWNIKKSVAILEKYREGNAEDYEELLDIMQELINLRSNIIKIEQGIRYGRRKEIKKFYGAEPEFVIMKQKKLISDYEGALEPFFSHSNPTVVPLAKELFYQYDFGDDWCVKITCVDAYTANEDYDTSYFRSHISEDGIFTDERKIKAEDLQYVDREGNPVTDMALRDKLQQAYVKAEPVCVMADGLNVMDDVGGLYGYRDFLRLLNSKDPEDAEEKESSKIWAKGMGWTGRMSKPENIL